DHVAAALDLHAVDVIVALSIGPESGGVAVTDPLTLRAIAIHDAAPARVRVASVVDIVEVVASDDEIVYGAGLDGIATAARGADFVVSEGKTTEAAANERRRPAVSAAIPAMNPGVFDGDETSHGATRARAVVIAGKASELESVEGEVARS